jgi:outer membrane protein assembly factor BamB
MRASIVIVTVLTTAVLGSGAGLAAPNPAPSSLPYAHTSWTTLHGDAGNHKYVDTRLATAYTSKWLHLAGAALTAAPSIGPGGRIYQTVAQGPGHSDLYAFDTAGNVLWQAPAWTDGSGFDSCAGYQTPIVDRGGDLYVSDCNQMWAFHPDGSVKWVAPLPTAPAGSAFQDPSRTVPDNSFVTAAFADEHSVVGATIFGQLVSYDRSTGAMNAPVQALPGGPGPAVAPPPASLWAGADWIDPEITAPLWQIAFAGDVVSANTPAVDPRSGRIFVVATASDPTKGALYGIDLLHAPRGGYRFSIAFAAPVGQGSGSSPTLSPDGKHAYVTDNNGVLYSVNSRTGAVEWTAQTDSLAQSVTVGPNGRIYVAGSADMFAFDPDGQQAWHTTFESLGSLLPALPHTGIYATFGPAAGTPAGPMTITNGLLLDPMNVGYPFTIPNTTITTPIAIKSVLVAINPNTGDVVRVLGSEADSAGANTPVDADSRLILAPHSAFTTLTVGLAPLVNPLLAPFGVHQLPALGGLEALAPTAP